MIYLQLKTVLGQTYSTAFSGTYSNAVDYYLGRVVTRQGNNGIEYDAVQECFEVSRPNDQEASYER
jgi:hypothetical protein